jgi:oxygen-independent coproporphyrinogen-3 oxidase
VKTSLRELLQNGNAFQGYAYAYPHKTAYRPLVPPVALPDVWRDEGQHALFLYAHVPFCEMRCGFCNLFTTANPSGNAVTRYLDALARQAEAVRTSLHDTARVARLALGGGTPTFLTVPELGLLFARLSELFPDVGGRIPKTVEASPDTLDADKIAFLKEQQVSRVSLGVQSFVESETRALGRPQRLAAVRQALGLLAGASFPCLNVDLIYGTGGQTTDSWLYSLEAALEFQPQEIYLYPLYVRPLTGLSRLGRVPTDHRLELYRAGRERLLTRGYRQVSMRLFRRGDYAPVEGPLPRRSPQGEDGPVYCCQEDGMLGLGAGARSYSSALHYSTEFAVSRPGVQGILQDFTERTSKQFAWADYGCRLDSEEQRRRYVLKSVLRVDGLSLADYRSHFGTDAFEDLPQLTELLEEELAEAPGGTLRLNARGFEASDVIGPWLASPSVRSRMESFALR